MFYQGDLQSGIAEALEHSKSVVCFVQDDGEESKKWEDEWLQDPNISDELSKNAITFRLEHSSQETAMLSNFCVIDSTPTIVVIHDGRLLERLTAGITKDEFAPRLIGAVKPSLRQYSVPPAQAVASPTSTPSMPETQPASSNSTYTAEQLHQPSNPEPYSQPTPSTNLQDVYSERRKRLEADKKAKEEAEKARRAEKGKARKQESEVDAETLRTKRKTLTYAQEQAQRKKESQLERERIKQQIENDKKERKLRQEQAKMQRQAALMEQDQDIASDSSQGPSSAPRPVPKGTVCSLQVRLMDGSTLRGRFSADDKLGHTLRPWIDAQRSDGNMPYTFKQVLTPQPSRSLGEAEEMQSLGELGLGPSATLVMVPVHDFAKAYQQSSLGAAGTVAWSVYAYAWALIMAVVNAIKMFLGLNRTNATPEAANQRQSNGSIQSEGEATSTSTSTAGKNKSGIRIRTLQDQNDKKDNQQLYNGNQLNFESNKRDDQDQ